MPTGCYLASAALAAVALLMVEADMTNNVENDVTETKATEPWEKQWRRFKLSAKQLENANDLMQTIIEKDIKVARANSFKDKNNKDKDKNLKGLPSMYNVIDFGGQKLKDRLKPLCRLFVAAPRFKSPTRMCTCSFVKPNVVLTAAHCMFIMTDQGLEGPETNKDLTVFVVRQYGLAGYSLDKLDDHVTHTRNNAQVATEWWTPASYKSVSRITSKFDIAFLKVAKPVTADSVFTPAIPKDETSEDGCDFLNKGAKTMLLGYPGDARDAELPVRASGKSSWANIGMQKKYGDFVTSNTIIAELLNAFGIKISKGNMFNGGSGGPWIAENPEHYALGPQCKMKVFGLTSRGDEPKAINASPEFTPQLILAFNKIASLDAAFSKTSPASVGAKVVGDEVNGVQMVDIELAA